MWINFSYRNQHYRQQSLNEW